MGDSHISATAESNKMTQSKEDLIKKLFEKGVLLSKEQLEQGIEAELIAKLEAEQDMLVLTPDYADIVGKEESFVDWYEADKYRVDFERQGDFDRYEAQLQDLRSSSLQVPQAAASSQGSNLASSAASSHEEVFSSLETEVEKSSLEKALDGQSIQLKETVTTIDAQEDLAVLEKIQQEYQYEVVYSFETISKKYAVKDFANIFKTRYYFLEKVIRQHPEMKNVTSISRVRQKRERETIAVIGLVSEIAETKNGNLLLTVEDITGDIKILISKNKPDLLEQGKELTFDEVIGITGVSGGDIIFADQIVWPDVPSTKEMRKAPKEEYAIFLSDIHVGSSYFMEDAFKKFISWARAEVGSEDQKNIARKVKYIFIAGDVVDGVGIYPKQPDELTIQTIEGQYKAFADLIKEIPKDKKIFICPGNHDVVHLAEPQPVFYKEYTEDLHEMENVELVSNPSMINIAKTEDFPGINVLMYHGYSFDFYVANVDSIRNNGGYHRADLIMKYLLKRRHLAPAFKSTPYLPSHNEDPLLIKKVPDIMITGHIHYSAIANYKGITMMSGSCWQARTKFQEKLGHDPQPGRVPVINLKTREVKVMKFI